MCKQLVWRPYKAAAGTEPTRLRPSRIFTRVFIGRQREMLIGVRARAPVSVDRKDEQLPPAHGAPSYCRERRTSVLSIRRIGGRRFKIEALFKIHASDYVNPHKSNVITINIALSSSS